MRSPTPDERRLLSALALAASVTPGDQDWVAGVLVEPLDDGGMGSLRLLVAPDRPTTISKLRIAADLQFKDHDGVDVLASLYVTSEGVPCELDIWKTDFSPIGAYPSSLPKATRRIN